MIQINDIGTYLKDHEIKPSYQRMQVFEYLVQNRTHPTVDTIYKALHPKIPTLSKTTVYNTLKLFHEKGIVIVINIEDNETRYDADMSLHGHFKCKNCGKVYDFEIDKDSLSLSQMQNFTVDETHIYLKGICEKCS